MSLVAQNEEISAILGVDAETMRIKRDAKQRRRHVEPQDTSNDGRKRKRRYIAG